MSLFSFLGNGRHLPLPQVPEICGYSLQQNALSLVLVVPYNGCNVIHEVPFFIFLFFFLLFFLSFLFFHSSICGFYIVRNGGVTWCCSTCNVVSIFQIAICIILFYGPK